MEIARQLHMCLAGLVRLPSTGPFSTSLKSRSFLVGNSHLFQSAIEIITGKPDVNRGDGGGGKQLVGEILGADVAPGQS